MTRTVTQQASLRLISFARKHLRNTWVHRLPITNAVYRALFQRTFKDGFAIINFRGTKLKVDTNDITIVPTLMTGEYEKLELDLLESMVQPGMNVIDVGANIGDYSLVLAKHVKPTGHVVAVEPVPENISLLRENIRLNDASKQVSVIEAAASNSIATLKIFMHRNSIGTHSAVNQSDSFIEVPTVTIDEIVKTLKLKKVDIIKLDIEGYEGFALDGARKTIEAHRPIVFMEFDSNMLKSAGDSLRFTHEVLIDSYSYIYTIDEKSKKLERLKLTKSTSLKNTNLLFSSSPIAAPGLTGSA